MALLQLLVAFLSIVTHGQGQTCAWGDFNLIGAQGYEIQCVMQSGTHSIGYTPCMTYALCSGERYQSVYFNRFSGVCEYYLAQWDDGETEPIFRYNRDGDDIFTWTFTYTNGQECDNTTSRTFDVVWKCDPDALPFTTNTLCQVDEDECYAEIVIPSAYACTEGIVPTLDPTMDPTLEPTVNPTNDPTIHPTVEPTIDPTNDPTDDPTTEPTNDPTNDPTTDPTMMPTARDESSASSKLEDRDVAIISLSVILGVALVVIAVGIYYMKCRKGNEHSLLRGNSNNEYNSMKDNDLQLTTKE